MNKGRSKSNFIFNKRTRQSLERKKSKDEKCVACGFNFCIHIHHIKRRADHPSLSKNKKNLVPLCKFCHRRVHSKRPIALDQIAKDQLKMISEIYAIAPSMIEETEYILNWALIDQLKALLTYELDNHTYCMECGRVIGLVNRSIIKLYCDPCRAEM